MFNINKYDTILSPVITEKSTNLSAQNKVVDYYFNTKKN